MNNIVIEGFVSYQKPENKSFSFCLSEVPEEVSSLVKTFNGNEYLWIVYTEKSIVEAPQQTIKKGLVGKCQIVLKNKRAYLRKCVLTQKEEEEPDLDLIEELI